MRDPEFSHERVLEWQSWLEGSASGLALTLLFIANMTFLLRVYVTYQYKIANKIYIKLKQFQLFIRIDFTVITTGIAFGDTGGDLGVGGLTYPLSTPQHPLSASIRRQGTFTLLHNLYHD